MVFFGLGILFASITFLLLQGPRTRWYELVHKLSPKKGGVADKVSTAQNVDEERFPDTAAQDEAPRDVDQKSFQDRAQIELPKQVTSNFEQDSTNETKDTGLHVETAKASAPILVPKDEFSDAQHGQVDVTSRIHPQDFSSLTSTSCDLPRSSPKEYGPKPPTVRTAAAAALDPVPTVPRISETSARQLMPPPSARPNSLRPLPKLGNCLNPPPSLAASLRGPLSHSSIPGSKPSLAATSSTLAPSARPSRKVILPPGHSPLDWAQLTSHPPTPTFLRGVDVPPRLIRVTPSQLREYNGRMGRDAWSTWQGKVYNITPYKKFHPGGEGELMRGAGKPGVAEKLFMEIHPWVNWDGMLGECLVGILVGDDDATEKETDLESMD
ncbi:hypothetical protein MMC34_005581 [Xylographa carneopallida]|nr:hypothetical protein [Xylographa carneopallida]